MDFWITMLVIAVVGVLLIWAFVRFVTGKATGCRSCRPGCSCTQMPKPPLSKESQQDR